MQITDGPCVKVTRLLLKLPRRGGRDGVSTGNSETAVLRSLDVLAVGRYNAHAIVRSELYMEVDRRISKHGQGVVRFYLPELTVSCLEAVAPSLPYYIVYLVGGTVTFQYGGSTLLADESKFAAEDDGTTVEELKDKLASVGCICTVGGQLTVAFSGNKLSVRSLEGH